MGKRTEPKHQQIAEILLGEIGAGEPGEGQPLLKEKELAVRFGVALGTLRQALARLEAEGVIHRVRGQGTFVTTPEQRHARTKVNEFALLVPQVREGFYPSLLHGVEEAAREAGKEVSIYNSQNDIQQQLQLIHRVVERQVAGLVMVPAAATSPPTPSEHVEIVRGRSIPIVFCHRAVVGVAAPLVTWSALEVGRMAAQTCFAAGHRRITTLAAGSDALIDDTHVGMREVWCEQGLEASEIRSIAYGVKLPGKLAHGAIEARLHELGEGPSPPELIWCFNLPDAEQVYYLATEMGLSIPGDLSLVCFSGKWRDTALAERITCVQVDECEVGRQAGRLLARMNQGEVPLDSEVRIEIDLSIFAGRTLAGPT